MKQEIAITGGLGFIGRFLMKQLSKEFQVRILDIKPPSEDFSRLANFVRCDIRNYQETANALNDVDLVIYTAIVQIPLINDNKS